MNPREQAFLILKTVFQENAFAKDLIDDTPFVQEVVYGTIRMQRSLEWIASQLTPLNKIKLKKREKALLYSSLYQLHFMNEPKHAVTDETVKIAKKQCPKPVVGFLNALLRKYDKSSIRFPDSLAIQYSYPDLFVDHLIENYSKEEVLRILELGNRPGKAMARSRASFTSEVMDKEQLRKVKSDPAYAIQNGTQTHLIKELGKITPLPKRILDLCASPGGKLLAAHDLFPEALLYANDVSQKKIERIKENTSKYNLKVHLSIGPGEEYQSEEPFDLIILDVPCSNSGVFNKRPEARWRYTKENIASIHSIQLKLLEHARHLLTNRGRIWYLTCSILPSENEQMIDRACKLFSYERAGFEERVLPQRNEWDGGYACCLQVM